VGNVIPGDKNPVVYVIAVRGVCASGAPRRALWAVIWVPGVAIGARGPISSATLARLGPRHQVDLRVPALPTSELTVHPGYGVGPVHLGGSYAALKRELGPPLYGAVPVVQATPIGLVYKGFRGLWFALGPAAVAAVPDRRGRIREVFFSEEALLAGRQISDGFAALHRALPGWKTPHCGKSYRLLVHRDHHHIETSVLYELGRFQVGEIAPGVGPRC
jgi:hypothetical protein